MKLHGYVPIYKETKDGRVLEYLNWNVRHHEMLTGKPTAKPEFMAGRANMVQSIKTGKIRRGLKDIFALSMMVVFFIGLWVAL